MNQPVRRRPGLLLALLGAALLLFPLAAKAENAPSGSGPCDFGGDEWSTTHFESGRGRSVTDYRQLREPAPRGGWRIDGGENGSVSVEGWEKNEIHVCAQVVAWARDKKAAETLVRRIEIETDGGVLRAEGPSQTKSARWAVSYRIFAPRAMDLSVKAMNGGIGVEGIRGTLDLRTVNGPVRIRNAAGDVHARTTNGPLDVELSGSRWSGRGLDAETTNGPMRLSVPERYSAELEAGTTHGPFQVTFPVTIQGKMRHKITTVLGDGGPSIRAITTNGPAIVQRPGESDADYDGGADDEDESDD